MEISLILLLSVAVYPMGALAGTLMPSLLGALGRRMREEEDPRGGSLDDHGDICRRSGPLPSVLPRIGDSDIVQVAVGDWGILVDRTGALGLVLVSMLGVLAGAVMLPQLSGESPARVLLACGLRPSASWPGTPGRRFCASRRCSHVWRSPSVAGRTERSLGEPLGVSWSRAYPV